MANIGNKGYTTALHGVAQQQLDLVQSRLNYLSAQKLLQPRSDGGWSIAQCLEHLNTYSRHYLPSIAKQLAAHQAKNNDNLFRSGWLGSYFIKMMQTDSRKTRYKAAKQHVPDATLNAESVLTEFTAHQQEFIKLLNKAAYADLNGIRIKTSISGFISLKLGDTLKFLLVHNERHLQQAVWLLNE